MDVQVREKCTQKRRASSFKVGGTWYHIHNTDTDHDQPCDGYAYRWITQEEWVKSLQGEALTRLADRLQGMSTREARR